MYFDTFSTNSKYTVFPYMTLKVNQICIHKNRKNIHSQKHFWQQNFDIKYYVLNYCNYLENEELCVKPRQKKCKSHSGTIIMCSNCMYQITLAYNYVHKLHSSIICYY